MTAQIASDRLVDLVDTNPKLPRKVKDEIKYVIELLGDINENYYDELLGMAHSLHEQAHGVTPWRACDQAPCKGTALELSRGPAMWEFL